VTVGDVKTRVHTPRALEALRCAARIGFVVASCTAGAIACSACDSSPDRTDGETGDAGEGARDATTGGAPILTSLAVSGSDAIELVPRFSSDVHDYYVRCAAGTNALIVSMTAEPGSSSSLTQPTSSPSLPTQTISVSVKENEAIVAIASNEAAKTEYWVRCLPHDFPSLQWAEHSGAGAPPNGYYLVGNLQAPKRGAYAIVLDSEGVPIWYYSVPTANGVFDVASLANGEISFAPWTFHASPYEIHHLDPLTTSDVTVPSQDEHELRVLPNGDYLLIASPLLSGVDLTGLDVPLADGGVQALGPNGYIQNCEIQEVDPAGTVVWMWTATDHLDPAQDCTWPQSTVSALTAPDGGVVVDTFHCNSIEVDPTNDNLLVSARHMDSIFYVEKSTGRILWKMGGATYTKDDATYVPVADPFHRQHDARFQPSWTPTSSGGSGQISLFDDETGMSEPARAVVYDVSIAPADAGSPGGSTGATVAWQYEGGVSSASMGSFRISPDGSRVVGWGLGGTPNLVFTEVDLAGTPLLDLYFADGGGGGSYRAVKVPPTNFERSTLRKTAGLP
jgi:arylsulfotransferase ASST